MLVNSNEVDKPRTCYTQWSKSEREKQMLYIMSYINTFIWNLERWYWWTYLQGSNGNTDIENRLLDTVGGGEGGMNWESSMETYTLPYIKQIASRNLLYDTGRSNQVLCDNQEGSDGAGSGRERDSRRRGHMDTCGWFMLMYGRDQHNIVKQLSTN